VLFVGVTGLACASGGIPMIGAIVNSGVIVVSILFLLTCSSLFRLRSINPSASSRYRIPVYPWLPLFGLVYAVCTVVFSFLVTWSTRSMGRMPTEWLVLMIWCVLGLFMWFGSRARRESISETSRAKLICSEQPEPL
jgi:basic amino acid/polyamine antiporter, APA family